MIDFAINELKAAASAQSCEDTLYVDLDDAIEILKATHGDDAEKPAATKTEWVVQGRRTGWHDMDVLNSQAVGVIVRDTARGTLVKLHKESGYTCIRLIRREVLEYVENNHQ